MEKKMKKLAVSLILGASLVIAPSVFALTSMTDSSMKSATAQAGVSITLDNVVIEQFIGATTYTDADGYNGNGGAIVISDKHVIKTYNALTGGAMFTLKGYAAPWVKAAALSIDVGTCSILMTGNNGNKAAIAAPVRAAIDGICTAAGNKAAGAAALVANHVTNSIGEANGLYEFSTHAWADMDVVGVVIGLPTLEILTTVDTYTVGVARAGAINDGANFIQVSKGASKMAIISGVVEIAAH
jgi:hypothetical protein